ncbi:MAG: hypothetical protein JRE14_00575 [Deltaproteobacteria bacterium]|nr:hypothetical protein [Deltaproteobacteria bacterium]
MEFSCPEKECQYDGTGSYMLNIPQEVCVDEQNVATPFCPHCGHTLIKSESDPEYFER